MLFESLDNFNSTDYLNELKPNRKLKNNLYETKINIIFVIYNIVCLQRFNPSIHLFSGSCLSKNSPDQLVHISVVILPLIKLESISDGRDLDKLLN